MFKFNRIVCVLLLCSAVGVAFGAATKIRAFIAMPGVESGDADGMCIINYNSGQDATIVQIVITDFQPYTVYDLELSTDLWPSAKSIGVLETNDKGRATAHFEIPGKDLSGAWAYIYTDLVTRGDANDTSLLRAYGSPS